MANEPSIIPTKVAEMNSGVLRQRGKSGLQGHAEHGAGEIDIETVEEHPDADQEHDAAVERPDRQPIETAARVYRCRHVRFSPLLFFVAAPPSSMDAVAALLCVSSIVAGFAVSRYQSNGWSWVATITLLVLK